MSADLDVLATQVKQAHADAIDRASSAVDHARRAGALLLEAKKQMKHGAWLPWLRDDCDLAERTAQTYMRLAKLTASEAQRVAHLPLRQALNAVSTPAPAAGRNVKLKNTFQVLVTCTDEPEQTTLLDRLTQEGFQCRAFTS